MTKFQAKKAHFLLSGVSYLILVYLIFVLLFFPILNLKTNSFKYYISTPLLFYYFGQVFVLNDFASTIIKYSVEFLNIQILLSTYCHIIIGMICYLTNLEINDSIKAFIS